MAKETDKGASTLTKVTLSVVGMTILVWGTAWAASRSNASGTFLVSSHETRITKVENDVGELDSRLDSTEKVQLALQKDQQAILDNQSDFKNQQNRQMDLIIKQIEEQAKANAWIRQIETIK